MAETINGDYYYETGTVNEELDNFQIYEDLGALVFYDIEKDEVIGMNGDGIDLASGGTYQVDGTQVVGSQEGSLTAADGSTVDSTYGAEERDVIQNNVTRIGEIETALQNHGLIA